MTLGTPDSWDFPLPMKREPQSKPSLTETFYTAISCNILAYSHKENVKLPLIRRSNTPQLDQLNVVNPSASRALSLISCVFINGIPKSSESIELNHGINQYLGC